MNYFEKCIYFSTNLLARRLNNIAEEAFSGMDITATQGLTLIAIGEQNKHSPSEIAKDLRMKPSTITRFLDKLESLEYLQRDYLGRKATVNLTSKGKNKLKDILECWKIIDDSTTKLFGDDLNNQIRETVGLANDKYIESE